MQLYEQYRPGTWTEVCGQDKTIARIQKMKPRGLAGRAYFIVGCSGTGKTTIARLLASEIADDWFIEEIDATTCNPSYLKKTERAMNLYAGGKGGRAFIINEAHALSKASVTQLLVLLERLPSHVMVIFTTTCDAQETWFDTQIDANPLLSRCIRFDLARRGLAQVFADRAYEIAEKEGLNGKERAYYLRLVQDNRNNMRSVLQAIESGATL